MVMAKMPHLIIRMPDKTEWAVPLWLVANHRAAKLAPPEADLDAFMAKEIAYTAKRPDVLLKWAKDNMSWREVEDRARQVRSNPNNNYLEGWETGDSWVESL